MRRVPVSETCLINPRLPAAIASQKDRDVDFVPMASLGEDGCISLNGSRKLGEVLKGYTYFENGDVLVAKITPCMENGKAAYVHSLKHGIAFGSTEFHVLRPNKGVEPRYLFHMVWTPYFRHEAARNMTGTAGQQRVPSNFFERFEIPLPPLPEQKRIADILDKADAIRRKRLESIAVLEEAITSLYEEIIGDPLVNPHKWEMTTLGEYVDFVAGFAFQSSRYSDRTGIRLLRGANVLPNRIDWSDTCYWPNDAAVDDRLKLVPDDVVLAMDRPWISSGIKVARVSKADLPCYLVQRVARLRSTSGISQAFIYYSLRHPAFTTHCGNRKTETTVPHISPHDIRSFPIPTVPRTVHERFASSVGAIERGLQHVRCAEQHSVDLFNSLVQRAFCGEL